MHWCLIFTFDSNAQYQEPAEGTLQKAHFHCHCSEGHQIRAGECVWRFVCSVAFKRTKSGIVTR